MKQKNGNRKLKEGIEEKKERMNELCRGVNSYQRRRRKTVRKVKIN